MQNRNAIIPAIDSGRLKEATYPEIGRELVIGTQDQELMRELEQLADLDGLRPEPIERIPSGIEAEIGRKANEDEVLKHDGSRFAARLDIGTPTNYTEIKSDGEINLHGTARVIRHIRITAPSWHKGAVAPANAFVGIFPTLAFDAAHDDEAYYSVIIPYRIATGSTIQVHIQWTYTGGQDNGTVCWKMEYIAVATAGTVAGSTTTIDKTSTGNHITGTLINTTLDTGIVGATAHDCLALRLWRDVSEDTLAADAELIQVHLHLLMDKLGEHT